jgi:hypothetical protein
MKLKTNTVIWLIAIFFWCIFMGVTAISIGVGAMFPPLNLIAKPFVCPNGQMTFQQSVSNPLPGTTYTTNTWYCVDQQAEQETELGIFPLSLYAGTIYGVLLFGVGVAVWYFYGKWNASYPNALSSKQVGWIQAILVIALVVGVTLFNLIPVFRSNAPATSIALTYEALSSGKVSDFNSTDKPLSSWNDIPIMPQATSGQQLGNDRYRFRVPTDSGKISDFYTDKLKALGWTITDSQFLGLQFTKDKHTLLVTLAPASDEESFVVTLVLVP